MDNYNAERKPDAGSTFLELRHIKKTFGKFTALDNINLTINKGEFVCLLGPSGCGKTTLLRIIAGLERPTAGQVYINGSDATKLPPGKRNFGIVFQSYALFPNMTVRQNVAFGLKKEKLSKKEMNERIESILNQVNLLDQIDKYPSQLSGGQQQRCAIARALIKNPKLLLCDEPTGALDSKTSRDILILLEKINAKYGTTMLIVTHNNAIKNMVHKVIIVKDGLIKKDYLNETRIPAAELEDL